MIQRSPFNAAFSCNGRLRDIYVIDTTIDKWNEFMKFLRSRSYHYSFTIGWQEQQLPEDLTFIFEHPENRDAELSVYVGNILFRCHFFVAEEIELDVNPCDVTSNYHINQVLSFLQDLGSYLHRDVVLTTENDKHEWFFRYSNTDNVVSW